MSAPTEPKRQPSHAPSGGDHQKRNYSWIFIGGCIFVIAWLSWTLFFAPAVPG